LKQEFLKELREISVDSLKANDIRELRAALLEVLAKTDEWFKGLAQAFGQSASAAIYNDTGTGRPPADDPPLPAVKAPAEKRKPPTKRRGRPVPPLEVELGKRPAPIKVGGADAATEAPKPAQIFQDSYVSKDGPRPGAALPPDHPRNSQRPSSVTPEVDMADFAEVEAAMKAGKAKDLFQ
jgi:hypothetical protein